MTIKNKDGLVEPCKSCPWRVENHNRKPLNGQIIEGNNVDDWFSEENRKRLWDGLADGENMTCHCTDSEMISGVESGLKELCIGSLMLKQIETNKMLAVLNDGGDYFDYTEQSKTPMTMEGLMRYQNDLMFPVALGGLRDLIPLKIAMVDVAVMDLEGSDEKK